MLRCRVLVGLLLSVALGCKSQDNRQLRDSIKVMSELISAYPDSVSLRLKKASYNLRLGQWEYAKSEYDYIIERYPQSLTALFYRAYANERLGRNAFARADYEAVLAASPNNFEAQLGLTLVNQKDKRYTEAFDMINRMIHQYPDSAIVYAIRAGMEKERDMLSLAEYDYSEAIKRDPSNTDYILNRADIRITTGKKEDARRDLDMLVKCGIPRASLVEFYKKCRK
ncbi:tetratricopeptide repeat protein [Xylanibacter caecicola]|uniref:tetratricopeptide repeat protein n=1 Tax=Xylanibacter caecicola TaxID=2736294 RepID=UPI002585B033|nr:tetratricopeptide repeat protein [Xylanibacter caecicola]